MYEYENAIKTEKRKWWTGSKKRKKKKKKKKEWKNRKKEWWNESNKSYQFLGSHKSDYCKLWSHFYRFFFLLIVSFPFLYFVCGRFSSHFLSTVFSFPKFHHGVRVVYFFFSGFLLLVDHLVWSRFIYPNIFFLFFRPFFFSPPSVFHLFCFCQLIFEKSFTYSFIYTFLVWLGFFV